MNKTILAFYIILISVCIAQTAAPLYPHYPYRRYTVDDGLPQSSILAISQDSRGFIWLATSEGVVRFDGHAFKVYNMESGYPFRLVNGVVGREKGKVWIATYVNGLWEIDGDKTKRIFIKGLKKNAVLNFIKKTSDGEILLGAEPGGLFVFKEDSLIQFGDEGRPLTGQVMTAAKNSDGDYWVGTFRDGIQILRKGKLIRRLTRKDGLPDNEIRTILPLPHGRLWIGTANGLFTYPNQQKGRQFNAQYPQMYIANLYSNNASDIWMNVRSAPGGIFHFRAGKLMEIIKYNENLFSKSLLVEKKQQVLLVGALRSLLVFPNRNFQQFGQQQGLHDTYIKSIGKDHSGTLWIGTVNEGLYQYQHNRIKKVEDYAGIFKNNAIYSIEPVKKELWLGTSHGLYILNKGRLKYNTATDFFKDKVVRRIVYLADEDAVYIILKKYIYVFKNNQISDRTLNLYSGSRSFWGLYKDKDNTFWLATNGEGIWRLKKDKWRHLETPDSQKIFYAVRADNDRNLYFPSANGLYRWDGEEMKKIIDIERTIWDVLPLHRENIWLLTSRGLLHYKDGLTMVFNHSNGFITSEFNMGALFYENEHSHWFGGVDGLVHYEKKLIIHL